MAKRIFISLVAMLGLISLQGCTNFKTSLKSSDSLGGFLGITELPSWYTNSQYTYPDSRFIINDFQLPMHYRDVGEGPVLLLLHGELSSLHTWDVWIDILSEDYRVIALDLPGAGLTGAPVCFDKPEDKCPEHLSLDYLKHSLQYFIKDLRLSSFTLIGSSLGGYLASHYAAENPEKIDRLILISPLAFPQEEPWLVDYLTDAKTGEISQYMLPTSFISTYIDKSYGRQSKIKKQNVKRFLALAQTEGARHANVKTMEIVDNLMEVGATNHLTRITSPTLIMWGERDKWGDHSHAEKWVNGLGEATNVDYPRSGHIPMEEIPEQSALDFLAYMNDEPMPTVEGLGTGGSQTLDQAAKELESMNLFGDEEYVESEEEEATETLMDDDDL